MGHVVLQRNAFFYYKTVEFVKKQTKKTICDKAELLRLSIIHSEVHIKTMAVVFTVTCPICDSTVCDIYERVMDSCGNKARLYSSNWSRAKYFKPEKSHHTLVDIFGCPI